VKQKDPQKQLEQRTQVRFPSEVWKEIKRLAAQHERSFNGEIVWALRYYIKQQKGETKHEEKL
jgi:predicted HicB family RNase H-like nuclease